jgi:hypothetical protein
MTIPRRLRWLLTGGLVLGATWAQTAESGPLTAALARGERTWAAAQALTPELTSREIFDYVLTLCESRRLPERVQPLLETAARMQNRDRGSRGYGNFRWRWRDGDVQDANAVEFCMQHGVLLRLRHWEALPAATRAILDDIYALAVVGCLRHTVPESYTNIALMNAQNLVLLGEALGQPEVLAEGKSRLEQICLYTAEAGIHEYASPTYYGVDLDCLLVLKACARDPAVRQLTEVLLELFWEDLAANWFAPGGRLGGTHSRDYDYLRGLGYLDQHLRSAGWLPAEPDKLTVLQTIAAWTLPAELGERNRSYPRTVHQRWGHGAMEARLLQVFPDVALSTSGAAYGNMDLPLTLDFAGDRSAVRGYFIADARRDPYGQKKIPAGGGHEKTVHLQPFWVGAQRGTDALGLAIYRDHDYPAQPPTLESHFVLPSAVDGIWVGEAQVVLQNGQPQCWPLPDGTAVVVRKGTAAAGVRLPWSRGLDGQPAVAALVYDGNEHGAMRVTVGHHDYWGVGRNGAAAGAAVWVSVGSGLASDQQFQAWRSAFAAAKSWAKVEGETIRVGIRGAAGDLELAAAAPYVGCLEAKPPWGPELLAVNGADVGQRLLAALPCVRDRQQAVAKAPVIAVDANKGTSFEAEAGILRAPMVSAAADDACGGKFVWVPGRPGESSPVGRAAVTWRLRLSQAGTYYLWGRVQAPTPEDDSFILRVATAAGAEPVSAAPWHLGTHVDWEWVPVTLTVTAAPTALPLPAGEVVIELQAREDGARLDRLFISADPAAAPQ